jgi:acyl-coenzyme A thioesterase PaaI-like protein
MSVPAAGAIPFRLQGAARERAARLFTERGEVQWFGFEGRLDEALAHMRFAGGLHRGLQGGGGTGAVNGGVIAAGFDAVAVLTGLGHYETDTIVTVDLQVQFLALALVSPGLAWQGWATRTTRGLAFVQGVLRDGDAVFATASAIVKPV